MLLLQLRLFLLVFAVHISYKYMDFTGFCGYSYGWFYLFCYVQIYLLAIYNGQNYLYK